MRCLSQQLLLPDVELERKITEAAAHIEESHATELQASVGFRETAAGLASQVAARSSLPSHAHWCMLCQALNSFAVITRHEQHAARALLALHLAELLFEQHGEAPGIDGDEDALTEPQLSTWLHRQVNKHGETYIKTAFFLAQLYQTLNDQSRAAQYCKLTLDQQLLRDHRPNATKVRGWIESAISLSEYYVNSRAFDEVGKLHRWRIVLWPIGCRHASYPPRFRACCSFVLYSGVPVPANCKRAAGQAPT